jgi:enamine deaminase RidA (YjgF/YER057c/UK114 family)
MSAPGRTDLEVVFRPQAEARSTAPGIFSVAIPPLTDSIREPLFTGLVPLSPAAEGLHLYRDISGDLLVGHTHMPFVAAQLPGHTRRLYARILAACAGRHLYRMWNYLPEINVETAGLEHYRAFCQGRSLAFEDAFGAGFDRQVPAASVVGNEGDTVDVIFVAGRVVPMHVENPEQVPAYRYPPDYGPRPPSFARATVVDADAYRWVFVSGTAAIKGHASVARGDLAGQIASTLDNLRLIAHASGADDGLRGGERWSRRFKIYLRHAEDFPVAARLLRGSLLHAADTVVWLRSDLCRSELRIEIEATLARTTRGEAIHRRGRRWFAEKPRVRPDSA